MSVLHVVFITCLLHCCWMGREGHGHMLQESSQIQCRKYVRVHKDTAKNPTARSNKQRYLGSVASAPPPSGSRLPSRGRPPSRIDTSNESFEDLRVRFRGARKQPPTLKCFNHVLHYYTSQHPQSQGRGIQIHGLAKPSRP